MTGNALSDRTPPHPIGAILSVCGSEALVGLEVCNASAEGRATVGKFLRIDAGGRKVIAMITQVGRDRNYDGCEAVAKVDLMGELIADARGGERFSRGVSAYPAIGDSVTPLQREDLRLVYTDPNARSIVIGALHDDATIPARVLVDGMLTRHFAVLGSTGVGKSSGVAVILGETMAARPDLRIFLIDGHNEFGRCFGDKANVVNAQNLKLPFWLFNFEELVDVLYGGRPGVEDEVDILAEHIPIAKGMYLQHRAAVERSAVRRVDPRRTGYTVDTPVPYLLQDLIGLIDERMGRLENRATRMHYHRLLQRIDVLRSDSRYAFMFENANVGGDTMAEILSHLFRLEAQGQPITVMQVAGLPGEVVDAVVSVVARMAFDFGLWSDGAMPMLFVCEEAHRFAPADKSLGFGPTRRALMKIAKEGRKYGVYLGVVTQRPAELDPTIISQCNTLFAMRLANERDQALLRSAVTDEVANLIAFVPSLGTREVIAIGEGLPLPARITFASLAADRLPHSETFERSELPNGEAAEREFVRKVVDRWRNALGAASGGGLAGGGVALENPPAPSNVALRVGPEGEALAPPSAPSRDANVAARLEQLRSQILKRGGSGI